MGFNFADAKRQLRQAVHGTLGVTALYKATLSAVPVEIQARWLNKTQLIGDLDHEEYARSEEAVDKVVLARSDSEEFNVKRGGYITFPDYENLTFQFNTRLPNDGPYDETWLVNRV